jgi:hypothetical protein
MAKNTKHKVYVGEIIFEIIGGATIVAGLVLAILGIVARYINSENTLVTNQEDFMNTMKLSFQQFGAILMLAGSIIIVITLVVVAKKVDLEDEKRARRAQRLSLLEEEMNAPEGETKDAEIVETDNETK